jgi:hypothetical protein
MRPLFLFFLICIIFLVSYQCSYTQVHQWSFAIGSTTSTGGAEEGRDMVTDDSGNVYICGAFNAAMDANPGGGVFNLSNAGSRDMFVAKYNAAGTFVWAFSLGDVNVNDNANALVIDNAGNLFIVGSFQGTVDFNPGTGINNLTSAGIDIFVSKYTRGGNFVQVIQIGGPGADEAKSITLDPFNHFYLSGEFSQTVDFNPGSGTTNLTAVGQRDVFVARYSKTGVLRWVKKFGVSNNETNEGVCNDPQGNVYACGSFISTADYDPGVGIFNLTTAGLQDGYLVSLDTSGNFRWAFSIGSTAADQIRDITVDNFNHVYAVGTFISTPDFDPGAGTATLSSGGTTFSDGFLAQYTTTGNYKWAFDIGSTSNDDVFDVLNDGSNTVYITGAFLGTFDFDPGPGIANRTGAGTSDIFVAQYDSASNYVGSFAMGGTGTDVGKSLALSNTCGLYVTGFFGGNVDFDPQAGTATQLGIGSLDVFLAKYTCNQLIGLPIELNSFSATCNTPNIEINWTTSAEINNHYFTLERSFDAVHFEELGEVFGAGNSSSLQTYTLNDANIPRTNTPVYYRLNQTDYNGVTTQLETISATCTQPEQDWLVYPNPNHGEFTITTSTISSVFTLVDMLGNVVWQNNSTQQINFYNVSHLNPGMYILVAEQEGKTTTQKIIIE